jgi:hypothetical protein
MHGASLTSAREEIGLDQAERTPMPVTETTDLQAFIGLVRLVMATLLL